MQILWWLCMMLISGVVYAQPTTGDKLLVYPIRTAQPTDTSFQDLQFLTPLLKDKQVVMLGEPTHSEGNVWELNTRLVNYLHTVCGFDLIVFESSFYDLYKTHTLLKQENRYEEGLQESIYPIWTQGEQFQEMLRFLYTHQHTLSVAGFDPQLHTYALEYLIEDIEQTCHAQGIRTLPELSYLDQVIEHMALYSDVPPDYDSQLCHALIQKCIHSLPHRDTHSAYLIQTLQGIQTLAQESYQHPISGKTRATFQASDANVRDRLMAENLLFLTRQYPNRKILCWGASPHFAKQVAVLESSELKNFVPMGQHVRQQLGDKVFHIGVVTSSGSYGSVADSVQLVPPVATHSLEGYLSCLPYDYACIPTQPNQHLLDTCLVSALEYTPLRGGWSEVFDAFLYVRTTQPVAYASHPFIPSKLIDSVPLAGSSDNPARQEPSTHRYTLTASGPPSQLLQLKGYIKDSHTHTPIPFATIRLQNYGVSGQVDGYFELSIPAILATDSLQISCVGFQTRTVAAGTGSMGTILLTPQVVELDVVQVQQERLTAAKIVRRMIDQLPEHYNPNKFTTEYYVHNWGTVDTDTVFNVEYVNKTTVPQGHATKARVSLLEQKSMLLGIKWNRKMKVDTLSFMGDHLNRSPYQTGIRALPVVSGQALGNFIFEWKEVQETPSDTLYVIHFQAKKTPFRLTQRLYTQAFQGELYIRAADYALVRLDMKWLLDTLAINRLHRKLEKGSHPYSIPFFPVVGDEVIRQSYVFKKFPDNHYYLSFFEQDCVATETHPKTWKKWIRNERAAYYLQHLSTQATDEVTTSHLFLKNGTYTESFWDHYPVQLNVF